MAFTLDYNLQGEALWLTGGDKIARPRTYRDRWGRWHRPDGGEWDWYYDLTTRERKYIADRWMDPLGDGPDCMATRHGMPVDEWAHRFLAAVRASRDRETWDDAHLWDSFADEERYREDVDQWVGPVEIAERLKVKVNTVAQWRKRFADFPQPLTIISGVSVWHWEQIEIWAEAHGRTVLDGPDDAPTIP